MSISRNTKTVKLLLKLFDKENNALSVVDLVSILSQEMNKTTVYRILQRLEDAGILHSFVDKYGKVFMEIVWSVNFKKLGSLSPFLKIKRITAHKKT